MLFNKEVSNYEELYESIKDYNFEGKIKVGVVCFLYDDEDNIIMLRRGPGARDEVNKLQAIGGSVNTTDENFKEALKREIREEAGDNFEYELGDFIAAQNFTTVDAYTNELTSWILLAYKGKLLNGELTNTEPERCLGFEKITMDNYPKDELSNTAVNFLEYMKENNI